MSESANEADLQSAAEHRYLSYALSVITSRALPDVRDSHFGRTDRAGVLRRL